MKKIILLTVLLLSVFFSKSQTLDSVYSSDTAAYYEDINTSNPPVISALKIVFLFSKDTSGAIFKVGRGKEYEIYNVTKFLGKKYATDGHYTGYVIESRENHKQFVLTLKFDYTTSELVAVGIGTEKSALILKIKSEILLNQKSSLILSND